MDKFRAQELREKSIVQGLTLEEMREIVQGLRKDRVSACFATKAAKTKKTKTETETKKKLAEDLFEDLDKAVEVGENDFSL